jgi:glycosyltransferase involved in cell wall biosynthesis
MRNRIHVAALTAGRSVPSARFRIGQYREPLGEHGIDLDWRPAPVAKYPPRSVWLRPPWLVGSIAARLPGVVASRRADVTLLGRELVSTLMTLEGLTRRPRVLDVDDAIWLTQRYGSIERLAGRVDAVMAGNEHVAEWFSRFCDDVVIVPTAVDTERFLPASRTGDDGVVIGWSGTSGNLSTLDAVWSPLETVVKERSHVRILITSDRRPHVPAGLADRVDFVPWSPDNEVVSIQGMDIGLMPLVDDAWSRGKCSYKMLLYMSCGVPVVTSPVGMNAHVLGLGDVGFAATGGDDWVNALLALVDDADLRRRQGTAGREVVETGFSRTAVATVIADTLKRIVGR